VIHKLKIVKTRLVPDMNSGVMLSGESQVELKSAEMFQKSEKIQRVLSLPKKLWIWVDLPHLFFEAVNILF